MKNKDKIIILKAKVIKLKEKLKAARLELADKDNGMLNISALKEGAIIDSKGNILTSDDDVILNNFKKCCKEIKEAFQPIESTKELFEGKGYVYTFKNEIKYYKAKIGYSNDKSNAQAFNSLQEYFEKYDPLNTEKFHFEPIQ